MLVCLSYGVEWSLTCSMVESSGYAHTGSFKFGLTARVLSPLWVYASPALIILMPSWIYDPPNSPLRNDLDLR